MSIKGSKLSLNDLTVLGLVCESQQIGITGLQLEDTVKKRGMRVWTKIGKSSIYHSLQRLERWKFTEMETVVTLEENIPPIKQKFFKITELGKKELKKAVFLILSKHEKLIDPFDIAFAFIQNLTQEEISKALSNRIETINERESLLKSKIEEFSLPEAHGYTINGSKLYHEAVIQHIIALFTRPLAFVEAEKKWLLETLRNFKRLDNIKVDKDEVNKL